MGTVPRGLEAVGRAEIQSGAKEMLLTRLETRLQCRSKVFPGERVGGRAEQSMTHVPGSIQEMSFLQRSFQVDEAGARHMTASLRQGLMAPG